MKYGRGWKEECCGVEWVRKQKQRKGRVCTSKVSEDMAEIHGWKRSRIV